MRWRQHGDLGRLHFAGAVYSGLGFFFSFQLGDAASVAVARIQLAAAVAVLICTLRYIDHDLGVTAHRSTRPLVLVSLLGLVLYELPGVGLTGRTNLNRLPWFDVPSVTGQVTLIGGLGFACLVVPLVGAFARYFTAWRRGAPYAGQHAVAFALVLVCGVNDALSASGLIPTPQLLPFGFAIAGALMGELLSRRWRDDVLSTAAASRWRARRAR